MSRPILIATIMRPVGDTGVQTHFLAFASWLRRSSKAVRIITPFDSPKWMVYPTFAVRRIVDALNGTASVWWYRHWHAVFLYRALHAALANGEPCVIYAQCPLAADAALRARASPLQRVVIVVHFNLSQADEWAGKGTISQGGHLFRSIRKFEEKILPKVDGLVFVSDFMRRELLQRIPKIGRVPSQVIPNFLDDPGEPVGPAERNDLITLGTLEHRKNQRYALEIVRAAAQFGRTVTLSVVGDGPDRAMLERLAREMNIDKQVRFMGFVANAAILMPSHSACLHVARMESFGIVLIEAMARGVTVFAPTVGGIAEVFDDGIEGRVIPLDDADAAAKLVVEWLDSPGTMEKAARLARTRFLRNFEAGTVAKNLLCFLSQENDLGDAIAEQQ